MAKRRSNKANDQTLAPDTPLKIVLDGGQDAIYANHAEVAKSPHDFAITFGRLPVSASPEQVQLVVSAHELHIPALVQIVFPHSMMEGLIAALTLQWERHNAEQTANAALSSALKPAVGKRR